MAPNFASRTTGDMANSSLAAKMGEIRMTPQSVYINGSEFSLLGVCFFVNVGQFDLSNPRRWKKQYVLQLRVRTLAAGLTIIVTIRSNHANTLNNRILNIEHHRAKWDLLHRSKISVWHCIPVTKFEYVGCPSSLLES
jgi:hypothetical protein